MSVKCGHHVAKYALTTKYAKICLKCAIKFKLFVQVIMIWEHCDIWSLCTEIKKKLGKLIKKQTV